MPATVGPGSSPAIGRVELGRDEGCLRPGVTNRQLTTVGDVNQAVNDVFRSNPVAIEQSLDPNSSFFVGPTISRRDPENAADVAQNTLLKAAQHIDGFRGEASVRTWLHTIATNECRMIRRRRQPESLILRKE